MARVATYERNLNQIKSNKEELTKVVYILRDKMNALDREFSGSAAKAEIGEKDRLNIMDRLMKARGGWYPNSYGPTELHMQSFEIAKQMYERSKPKILSPGVKQAWKTAVLACEPEWGWTFAYSAPYNSFALSIANCSTTSTISHPP